MKILIIDTTSPLAALTLCVGDKQQRVPFTDRYNQSRDLPKFLQRLLRRDHSSLGALDAIAVVTGPGSFTSIRVGVSFANALAYGEGIPAFGISLFDWARTVSQTVPLVVDGGSSGIFTQKGTKTTRYTQVEYAQLPQKARRAIIGLDAASLVALVIKRAPGAIKKYRGFIPVVPFYGSKPNITTPKRSRKKR